MALTHARLIQYLAETDYFGDLDLISLSGISSRFEVLSISEGEVLFAEGSPGDAWFIIAEGSIGIWGPTPAGPRCKLTELGDGDSFGELALLEDITRSAAAVAAGPTQLLKLPRAAFHKLLQDGNPAAIQMLKAIAIRMSRRMREMSLTIQDLSGPTPSL